MLLQALHLVVELVFLFFLFYHLFDLKAMRKEFKEFNDTSKTATNLSRRWRFTSHPFPSTKTNTSLPFWHGLIIRLKNVRRRLFFLLFSPHLQEWRECIRFENKYSYDWLKVFNKQMYDDPNNIKWRVLSYVMIKVFVFLQI